MTSHTLSGAYDAEDAIRRATSTSDLVHRVTEIVVCAFPEDDFDGNMWAITVAWRGPGDRYAVIHRLWLLMVDGTWEMEPQPSSREDDWKARARYPLAEAMELATYWAPKVRAVGMTAAEFMAWRERKAEEDYYNDA